jgi:hypothetical protein
MLCSPSFHSSKNIRARIESALDEIEINQCQGELILHSPCFVLCAVTVTVFNSVFVRFYHAPRGQLVTLALPLRIASSSCSCLAFAARAIDSSFVTHATVRVSNATSAFFCASITPPFAACTIHPATSVGTPALLLLALSPLSPEAPRSFSFASQ